MKAILSLIISGALVVSGFGQTRNVLVGTNSAVVQPTNFWSADASNARTGLGLGSAATNPASAFQPSSAILSNLATGNGTDLTNIAATIVGTNVSITNVSGLQAALDAKLATNGSAANLTSFPSGVLQTNSSLSLFPAGLLRTNGDGSGLTNLPVPAVASNVLSTISIEKGGTGATNAYGARISLGGTTVGINLFTAVDAAAARSALGVVGSTGGVIAISNGGSGASTASGARTNFGLGESDGVTFSTIRSTQVANSGIYNITMGQTNTGFRGVGAGPSDFGYYRDGLPIWFANGSNLTINSGLSFSGSSAGVSRTNLGLPWIGLTNTNASTFRNALEIGTTNTLTIAGVVAQNLTITAGGGITLQSTLSNAGSFRTNIGLPWSGLTSADAPAFRTALGLGTAATNPASAFQASSANLTTLAANNGGSLTNLQATSLVGIIPSSNIATVNFSNLAGTLSIASGGTGATNAANARQNLGSTTVGDAVFIATNAAAARTAIGSTTVGSSLFTLANPSAITFLRLNADNTVSALSAADFRTALSLGTAATNPATAFQPASSLLTNLASSNGGSLTNIQASSVVGTIAISNGGSGATTAGGARTNFGLGNISTNTFQTTNTAVYINTNIVVTNGRLTTTNIQSDYVESTYFQVGGGTNGIKFETTNVAAITRTNLGIGAGATNTVGFGKIISSGNGLSIEEPASPATIIGFPSDADPVVLGAAYWNHGSVRQSLGFSTNLSNFWASASIAAGRTNLGIPLAALTNTNNANFLAAFFGANTNPVLVNTNGEVISPTNFWQAAPINTVLQNITNVVGNSTNAATNARMLFLYSLAPTVTNVTSTITLPTNGSTFGGDVATITHLGPTNSVTAIRALGASTNLIALNQSEESVRFIYRDGQWRLMDNISYIEPIFFSGTNASANAAASRTNLGLGDTNSVSFLSVSANSYEAVSGLIGSNGLSFEDGGQNVTRTNLGLPLAALTNTTTAGFQRAIFQTNATPAAGANLGDAKAWLEISVVTNNVTNSFRIPVFQ